MVGDNGIDHGLTMTGRVLFHIAKLQQTFAYDELVVEAWHKVIGDLDPDDAMTAVEMYFREANRDGREARIQAGNIVENVKRIRAERQRARDRMSISPPRPPASSRPSRAEIEEATEAFTEHFRALKAQGKNIHEPPYDRSKPEGYQPPWERPNWHQGDRN